MAVALDLEHRRATVRRLTDETFDLVVIGGGVVGTGTALDAATRGLSVALLEARDWAAGTSSRSSKLIHGGLRYLEQLEFPLVQEALRERGLLLNRLAPHLVKPVSFVYPLTRRVWERFYVGSGVMLYDTIGGARQLPMHRHLTKTRALEIAPGLKPDAFVGALQYYDAQVDDARHTMVLARTAAQFGAAVATSMRVEGVLRDGDRVCGVSVRDLESDTLHDVRARVVIGAAGVWTYQLESMAGVAHAGGALHVRASKGIHVVVPRSAIDLSSGLITRTEKSVLFIIPWQGFWLIGTTDTDWTGDLSHPAVSGADVDYVLGHVNAALERPLSRADVVGAFAGLRPLLAGDPTETSTAKLSREHTVAQPAPGLVVVAGGKYTTYRVMAADAVEVAGHSLGSIPDSVTDDVPLLGADGYAAWWNMRQGLAERHVLPVAAVEHLLDRYGSLYAEVLAPAADDPSLLQPLPGAPHYLLAEVRYAATHEGALHLEDVLERRLRVAFETRDGGAEAAQAAVAVLAPVLAWDDATARRELDHWRARAAAVAAALQTGDDASAQAARLAAPDLFPRYAPAGL